MSGTAGDLGFEVRLAEKPEDREACFAVRREVFVEEQGVDEALEYDVHDEPGAETLHLLAVGPEGPLGTGRLLRAAGAEEGVGALGRLAVLRSARGRGVGAALVRAVEEAARGRGFVVVDLHAQVSAVEFYERLGYVAYGGEFLDAGIVHRAMRKAL
ncbi:GNAT family N-acetyltransferase [Streptomyces sp. NPDC001941]|uniref:GNAT family N-acetyltransferase n=1 Tax=Streptomyces sp. NPDC001941 TaxID=3154659 RepID=UPI00332B6CE2